MKILQVNQEYNNKLNEYKVKDGISAFVLMGIMLLLYSVMALLEKQSNFIRNNILAVGCVFNLIMIGITIIFIKKSNKKIDTIGLYKGNWKASCVIGVVLAGILFFNNCLSHILAGEKLIPVKEIMMLIIYYLLVSFCEEIVFRGYIGTRLFGLVKKKWLAVIVTGLLFIIMHFPYRMIAYEMTLGDLTINNMSWIIDLFITHTILSYIYMKTNSLYGSIIPHWISNLAYNIVVR